MDQNGIQITIEDDGINDSIKYYIKSVPRTPQYNTPLKPLIVSKGEIHKDSKVQDAFNTL